MKLELLQSISVAVMIAGLFLAALGGYGAYFFGAENDRARRRQTADAVQTVDSRMIELLVRHDAVEAKLASIAEPVAGGPPLRPTRVIEPPSTLPPPVGEGPDDPPEAAVGPQVAPPTLGAGASGVRAEMVAPRFAALGLAGVQVEKMLQRLRVFPEGSVAIHVPEGSEETLRYAEALKDAFIAADWRVAGVQTVQTTREPKGITLSSGTFPPPMEVTTIFSALVTAGIKVSTDLDPAQGRQRAVLFIGSPP